MIKLGISGSMGRMGQAITRLAQGDKTFKITTLLEDKNHPQANTTVNTFRISSDKEDIKNCQILIEFTTPQATIENLKECVKNKTGIIIGTTGLNEEQINEIKKASKTIPVVFSSNMSVGVNLLFKLTKIASQITSNNYSIKITEAHHIHKKDAPSGTAKTIAQIAETASGNKISDIESIREGEIVGDHTIFFESEGDVISISHHAKSRDILAQGALVAAKFLSKKNTGLYDMQDVLGLN